MIYLFYSLTISPRKNHESLSTNQKLADPTPVGAVRPNYGTQSIIDILEGKSQGTHTSINDDTAPPNKDMVEESYERYVPGASVMKGSPDFGAPHLNRRGKNSENSKKRVIDKD